MTDESNPYLETNYFNQEWSKGTLSKKEPDKPFFIDERRNPTNVSEQTYANILQNYYIYKPIDSYEPIDSSSGSIMNLTSFYKPNHEIFNILEVFKPLDQGHDFYTKSRNTDQKNWTWPSEFSFNNVTMDNYNQFQANTSFGGGHQIFGLVYIEDDSYKKLLDLDLYKTETNELNINELLKQIKEEKRINKDNINKAFEGNYGVLFNISGNNILFLSIYTKDIYNNGMHSLWNFNTPSHVYAVQVDNDVNFKGYKLYECKNIIPEYHVPVNEIVENYISKIDGESNMVKYTKIAKIISTTDNIESLYKEIKDIIDTSKYKFDDIKRGYTLVINNFIPTSSKNSTIVNDFFITQIYRYYYSKLNPNVTDDYSSFIESNNHKIKETKSDDSIYKIPVSVIDANTGPKESLIVQGLRDINNENELNNYPYKYSIVSANVDGSGLGGQVFPSYHPPELSIYMTIFDSYNVFHGFIYRICFLKKINSNILNSKANVDVDMHYCFFNITDFDGIEDFDVKSLSGQNINEIKDMSNKVNEYILQNTTVYNNILKTRVKTLEKIWYKFTIQTKSVSVLDINNAIQEKKINNLITSNRMKIQTDIEDETKPSETKPSIIKSIATNIYNLIFSTIQSDDPNLINNIISTSIKIYLNDQRLKEIFDLKNFVRIFLIRNKYIGDNSRATDTLYSNKEMIIEPIQFSNDINTLSTAKIANVSSVLAPSSSAERYIYMAPYLTNVNKQIITKKRESISSDELDELNERQESSSTKTITAKTSKKPELDEELILTTKRKQKTVSYLEGGVKRSILDIYNADLGIYSMKKKRTEDGYDSNVDNYYMRKNQPTTYTSPKLNKTQYNKAFGLNKGLTKKPQQYVEPKIQTNGEPVMVKMDVAEGTTEDPHEDTHFDNLKTYLTHVVELIKMYNTTQVNGIVNLYLTNITKNIYLFNNSKIEDIIEEIENNINSKDKLSSIESKYNCIFRDFNRITGLQISASYLEVNEYINDEDFDTIYDKLNNIYNFTQNIVDILNVCEVKETEFINEYNCVILNLYEYLTGYYNNNYDTDDININGLNTFIGIYCFFMYFTIEFNNKINKTFGGNNINISPEFFSSDHILKWLYSNIDNSENNDKFINKDIIKKIEGLSFGGYINFTNKKNILEMINVETTNKIEKTIKGSLIFLMDDDYIDKYINNYNFITEDEFLMELYKNELYGLITPDKFSYYFENDDLKIYIKLLLDTKNNIAQGSDIVIPMDTSGGTIKNRYKKLKKYSVTKNKNKTYNKNKKTIKKRVKKTRHNTIRKF